MNQKGFIPIIYIIVILLVLGGILGSLFYSKDKTNNTPAPSPQLQISPSPSSSTANEQKIISSIPTPAPTQIPTSTPVIPSSTPTQTSTPAPKVTCAINTDMSSGWAPLNVHFSYSASDQSKVTAQEWDLDGNGTWESEQSNTNWVYNDAKSYEAKLRLKLSNGGYSDICSKTIVVNSPRVDCQINADVTSGPAPLTVKFVYGASFYGFTEDNYVTDVQWDFNGDGTWDTSYDSSSQQPPPYTYSTPGSYTVKMHLKSFQGSESEICTKNITVN